MKKIGLLILLLVMSIGSVTLGLSQYQLNVQVALAEERTIPAQIELVVITVNDCEECSDPYAVIDVIEDQFVEVKDVIQVTFNSDEGRHLIEQYDIAKLPAVISTGEITKSKVKVFFAENSRVIDNVSIIEAATVPYIDSITGEERGRVKLTTIMDSSCTDCYDTDRHYDILSKSFGMVFDSIEIVDVQDAKGRELAAEYQIKLVPTMILQGDVGEYEALTRMWNRLGTVDEDETYIFRTMKELGNVTYKNIQTGEIINQTQGE